MDFFTILKASHLIMISIFVGFIIMFFPTSMMKLKYFVVFISNSHLLTFNCSPVSRKRLNFLFICFWCSVREPWYKSIYRQYRLNKIRQKIPESPINIFLKNVKSFGQTERNHEPFEKTIFCFKCCHPFVPFGYFYFMKNRSGVELGIPFGYSDVPEGFVN